MYRNTHTHTLAHTPTETSQKGSDGGGFGWQTFLLDLRDCCSALDAVAVVVIVIVIITALAKVVVLAFIDLPPH